MKGLTVAGTYFTEGEVVELVNNYHLARTAVGDNPGDRMQWAAKWFSREHEGIPEIRAYKALERSLASYRGDI